MAALYRQLPGVQAILHVPTSIVRFRTHVFGHQSNDSELRQYANLFRPFLVDVNNAGNNLGLAIIRSQIAAKGVNLDPLALAILHDGVVKVYLCPQNLDQPLGQPHNVLYDKLYVFDSNIRDNYTYHAILPNEGFNLIPNNILVTTFPQITATLGGDRGLREMVPYLAGDVNTETVRVQRVIPLPCASVSAILYN